MRLFAPPPIHNDSNSSYGIDFLQLLFVIPLFPAAAIDSSSKDHYYLPIVRSVWMKVLEYQGYTWSLLMN